MNGVDGDSVLNSHICFNALATLQHLKNVENSCSFCSASDHSTYICPVLSQGEHVKDTSIQNMSRSSVPHGLQVYENDNGTHIISGQKFAKGCRFGPLLAPYSYIPIANAKFPLTIFGNVNLDMDGINMPELKELFKVRNIFLDTRNENNCNWMIHVDPATCINEQNLIAYEEDNEIFFAAIEDLDVGDILKVWYAPKYAERMNVELLKWSPYQVVKNVFHVAGVDGSVPNFQFFNNTPGNERHSNRTEISLPPIKSLIKPSSYVCYENRNFTSTPLPNTVPLLPSPQSQNVPSSSTEASFDERPSEVYYMNQMHDLDLSNVLPDTTRNIHPTYVNVPATSYAIHDADEDVVIDGITEIASANSSSSLNSDKEEKKIYPCQLCDKKYSTMTNIYRHVRTLHNFFLCSLCMNMFPLESDLKEHIHRCPKSDVKKPQCSVCMQYFSNSWSLTRHVKIHVTAGECDADVLTDKKAKDKKNKGDSKDSIDLSDLDKNSRESLATDASSTVVGIDFITSTVPSICDFETEHNNGTVEAIELPSIVKSESNTSMDMCGIDELSACIVCDKKFKSQTYLKKHLRTVHTVKILSTIKRPAASETTKKSAGIPSKRSTGNEINPAVTVTGAPVNPSTAKALASKLTERSNQLHHKLTTNGTVIAATLSTLIPSVAAKEIPIPPLVSLQHTTQVHRPTETENIAPIAMAVNGQEMAPPPITAYQNEYEAELNVPTFNIMKKSTANNHIGMDDCNYDIVPFTTANDVKEMNVPEKLHHCDLCGKKFNKKYELKRHKAVHENITFTCPYCAKVVKRKPSMIKHLRLTHTEFETEWNQNNFVDTLKKYVNADLDEHSTTPPSLAASPTSQDSIIKSKVVTLFDDNSYGIPTNIHSDLMVNHVVTKKKYQLLNNNNNLPKPKKSPATKSGKIKNGDGPKKSTKTKATIKARTLYAHENGLTNDFVQQQHTVNNVNIIQNQYNVVRSSSSSSSPIGMGSSRIGTMANGIGLIQTSNVYHQQHQLQHNQLHQHIIHSDPSIVSTDDTIIIAELDKNTQYYATQIDTSAVSEAVSAAAILLSSTDGLIGLQPQAVSSNPTATSTTDYIIDNCFFAEDALNCNVLHSPFSSDNDVDGFIIANSNEGSTSNKELLNKFHDRLEEMEEKIDNSEYKLYWNGESDEDNEDERIHGVVDDDDDNIDGQDDATTTEFAEMIVPKPQFNEFV